MKGHIEFETALLLREKGYKEPCDWRYDEESRLLENYKYKAIDEFFGSISANNGCYAEHYSKYLKECYEYEFKNDDNGYYVSAPTQEEVHNWLIENHKLFITITDSSDDDSTWFDYSVSEIKLGKYWNNDYKSYSQEGITLYQDCFEQALVAALNLI